MTELGLNIDATSPPTALSVREKTGTWEAVTRAMAAGDEQSFAVYYERFFDLMLWQVRKLIDVDEATALDLVQEGMIKAMRCIKPIDSEAQLTAWTRAVVKSTCYDWLRKNLKHVAADSLYQLAPTHLAEPSQAPARPLELEARLAWIEEQLQQLPRELRRMVELRYRWGWKLRQIANLFQLNTGTVDGRIRRAVADLKRQAEIDFDE